MNAPMPVACTEGGLEWDGKKTMGISRDAVSYMQLVRLLPLVFLCRSVFDILSL